MMVPIFFARLFVDAWAVWVLWGWFVEPLGAPHLTYWHAMGLDLFIGLLLMFGVTTLEDDAGRLLQLATTKLFATPIVVGLGWVVLQVWERW